MNKKSKKDPSFGRRQKVLAHVKQDALIEAGYRCAVPTCRTILAIDLHHLDEVRVGGGNTLANLIALCPTCHQLHHRGQIPADALYVYKSMLVTLSQAFDLSAVDRLLFLEKLEDERTRYLLTGDGLLHFAGLIAADLASFAHHQNQYYYVGLSERGRQVVAAWRRGNRVELEKLIARS